MKPTDTLIPPVVDVPAGFKAPAPVRPEPMFWDRRAESIAIGVALIAGCCAVALCLAGGW